MHPNLDNPAHPIPSQAHSESYPIFTKGNPATHFTPSYFWEQTLSNTTVALRRVRLPEGYPAHASSPLAGVIVTKQERRHSKESGLLLFTTEDKMDECWCLVQLINMHSLWHLPCTCGCPPFTCTCSCPLLTCTCGSPLCWSHKRDVSCPCLVGHCPTQCKLLLCLLISHWDGSCWLSTRLDRRCLGRTSLGRYFQRALTEGERITLNMGSTIP